MKMEELLTQVENADPRVRRNGWNTLSLKRAEFHFTHDHVQELLENLRHEKDGDLRGYGLTCLVQGLEWARTHPQETFQDWLFKPFLPRPGGHGINSAVVAICDQQHIRDVQPLNRLARFLPADRYHATDFHEVSLREPSWESVRLDKLSAVCFVGRPSMYRNCKLLDALPRDLRFTFTGADDVWRGRELTDESVEKYHHVRQNQQHAGPILHRTSRRGNRRTDYGVVQRFRVDYGGRPVTVLIVAGSTSLGTVGAAEWVTSRRFDDRAARGRARAARIELDDAVRMEVLLEVHAEVHEPAQPWRPEECIPRKMFFNGSPNLIPDRPASVTLRMDERDPSSVRYVLFDEDEVRVPGDEHAALVALCLKCSREQRKEVPVADLLHDRHVWPASRGRFERLSVESAVNFYREHLKRKWLRDGLSVISKPPLLQISFDVRIEQL